MSSSVQDPADLADALFKSLTGLRLTEKYKAIELLSAPSAKVDHARLRLLISDALAKKYQPGRERTDNDPRIAETRSWLLSALARVAGGDDEMSREVARYTRQDVEPNRWGRYWALEGLIFAQNPHTLEAAKQAAANDDQPLVSMLAYAYLALREEPDALDTIKHALENPKKQWATLRALRVVPLPFAAQFLCELVGKGENTDETYDAVIALGRLDSGSAYLDEAAQALTRAIITMRGAPWKDGMRSAAITALGHLGTETSGPLLIEELTDDNPAIVREAARALEKILGLQVTVSRVVEVASRNASPAAVDAFGRALRWMNREAVAGELEKAMDAGATGLQEVARNLLSELGGAVAFDKLRARTASMKQYETVLERAEERVRTLFEQTVTEAQKGFRYSTNMDFVIFGIGVALILVSGAIALFKTGDFASWAGVGTGATGLAGVLYNLWIAKPRKQVVEAVDHLMRVKIVFLAYLRRLHQTDQAFARLLLENAKITVDELKAYSEIVNANMELTAKQFAEAAKAG